jgi:hypothetical protein
MTSPQYDVTPEEAKRVYDAAVKARGGKEPPMHEIADAFASIGRLISERTLRRWRRKGWDPGRQYRSPFERALVVFNGAAARFNVDLTALTPDLIDIKMPSADQAMGSFHAMMVQLEAMRMADLIERNARMMISTSIIMQTLIHQHGKDMMLDKPTGLAQLLRELGRWNDFAYRSIETVVMLRERSMKMDDPPKPRALPSENVVLLEKYIPPKLGEKPLLAADDALAHTF